MKNILFKSLLMFLVFLNSANACTIFTATKGKTVLFASNEDQSPNQSYLVVDATGKYGVVFIATSTDEFPFVMQMGINEKGVSYDINSISKENLVHTPNTIQQKEWALVELMKEVQSVNEMLEKFFEYDWGNSISYQIHIADRFGDAAVIHPGQDGKLTFTRIDKNKGYLISTNFNLRDIKFDRLLSPRYLIADHKLKTVLNNGELTYELMASVLDATHQEQGWINPIKTIYSVVLDLNTLDIHLYYDGKFEKSYLLNVKSELSNVSGKKIVPMTEVLASKINN